MDEKRKTGRRYLTFFGLVCVLFIGLLCFVYNRVSHASIVMLDEHGKATR
jgi:hypothetical protein